jgi:hypothetical protein
MTNNNAAQQSALSKATFGFLLIASFLWLAGGLVSTLIQGLPINWLLIVGPLFAVLLFQTLMTWVAATIREAVAEGLILGLTVKEVQDHLANNRDQLN